MDSPITLKREVIYDSETPERMVRYREKVGSEILRERVRRSRQNRPITERREYERKRNLNLRLQALMFLGGRCVKCGNNDYRVLQIDHINGGGTKENKKIHSRGVALKVFYSPSEYQVLCANCNWIKRSDLNENKQRKG